MGTSTHLLLVEDVDDDASLIERMLRREGDGESNFRASRAGTIREALTELSKSPVDLVLLDLGLPDAVDLGGLRRILGAEPHTPVIVLTGLADCDLALKALQEGAQDYLVKGDFSQDSLRRAIRYARERARILESERQLLEETLRGSIDALTKVLSLTNPTAFGRARRLKQYAIQVAEALEIPDVWPIAVAAMVSQVGCIHLPEDVCRRLYAAENLTSSDRLILRRIPSMAERLLSQIPRLEPVRVILEWQERLVDAGGIEDREQAPIGARILHAVTEMDLLESAGGSIPEALNALKEDRDRYDHEVIRALADTRMRTLDGMESMSCSVATLQLGLILASDVLSKEGKLLVARGEDVTEELAKRIQRFAEGVGVQEPLRVHAPRGPLTCTSGNRPE